ncbi:hypothetical protein NQ317_010169 [Molorchus minor]|uniref:Uncharacterized protein n=1 Tax=Molorchus minor TaxID=1323400 RepID=A0ABQ9IT32_9CUCU|nr:hypothetical protein NQ317_010169 [Molorchus minor]
MESAKTAEISNQIFGHATEIDIFPLEVSFQSCVEGGYTYRRHRTHNHSLNRCQLFSRSRTRPMKLVK